MGIKGREKGDGSTAKTDKYFEIPGCLGLRTGENGDGFEQRR